MLGGRRLRQCVLPRAHFRRLLVSGALRFFEFLKLWVLVHWPNLVAGDQDDRVHHEEILKHLLKLVGRDNLLYLVYHRLEVKLIVVHGVGENLDQGAAGEYDLLGSEVLHAVDVAVVEF